MGQKVFFLFPLLFYGLFSSFFMFHRFQIPGHVCFLNQYLVRPIAYPLQFCRHVKFPRFPATACCSYPQYPQRCP
ncbi:hypothetical protein 1013_scaffold47_00026 [Bacteriophage sp.]|nr:hypothetical protein 1013_scaffold47_00026 [Bacteriophage sp.]